MICDFLPDPALLGLLARGERETRPADAGSRRALCEPCAWAADEGG